MDENSVQLPEQFLEKKHMKWLPLVLILVTIAIIGITSYIFLLRPNDDKNIQTVLNDNIASTTIDTLSWKTYGSKTYGFSIKLPENWVVSSTAPGNGSWSFQSSSTAEIGHGIGIPTDGMWVNLAEGVCNNPTPDFVPESKPDILERTVCKGNFQITLGLLQSDINLDQNKKILNQIADVFDLVATSTKTDKISATSTSKIAPSTTKTISSQKTSSFDNYGFTLTPPAGWKYEVIDLNEPNILTSFKYTSPDAKKSFILSIFGNMDPEKITMAKWGKQDSIKYDPKAKQDEEEYKVGANVGSIYKGEINGKLYKRAYLIRGVQQHLYRFVVEIDKSNSWMPEFDKTLSTFKLFEPKTNSTEVYKNVQFSFELTLPSTWRARQDSSEILLRNYYTFILDLPIDPIDVHIYYLKDKNPNQLSINEWLKVDFNDVYVANKNSLQKVNIGDEAVKSIGETALKTPGKSLVTYVIRKGKDIIQVSYVVDNNIKYAHDPGQVISTIKFTSFDSQTYNTLVQEENNRVIGTDADKDGVWDYIQQWIDKNYSGNIKTSLRLMAKETQFDMLNYRDKEVIYKHAQETFGNNCLYKAEPDYDKHSKISDEFVAQMVNTEDRLKAYFQADGQKGGVYSVPDDDDPVIIKYCGF